METGKSPRHDGKPIEFLKCLWHALGYDFYQMIQKSIAQGAFHEEAIKGVLSLIPKEGDGGNLNNQSLITLLTTIYKLFAKMLQRRLQPVLSDIISPKQMTFLSLRFILDSIVFT